MVCFVIRDEWGEEYVFSGDTLFKNSIGGGNFEQIKTRRDGRLHGDAEDARRAMPGHTDVTTIQAEWQNNPFVRVWRGEDPEGTEARHGRRPRRDADRLEPRLRRQGQGAGCATTTARTRSSAARRSSATAPRTSVAAARGGLSEKDSRLRGDAPDRRPLRGHLHRPAQRLPARVDAAADGQGRRLGARARGRRRVQAVELDDAADRLRGRRRRARRPQARRPQRGPPRDPAARGALRRRARDGRGGRAREGRRRARPAGGARGAARERSRRACASSAASGRPTSARST